MKITTRSLVLALPFLMAANTQAQSTPWSQQLSATAVKLWPDSFSAKPGGKARWSYDQGVILKGIEGVWNSTGDGKWFQYIQHSMDYYVKDDGSIYDYRADDYNIDNVNNGRMLLLLYRVTNKEKYRKAAAQLRAQLQTQPRTSDGGFWHKKIYPGQMWLDGLYMGEPFYAEYAKLFHDDTAFNDIARQFILMEKHARDPKTGLLYHGWDETKEQQWANKQTGTSPNFWSRSLGWYGMALVDVLDYFPANHPQRKELIAILNRLAAAVIKTQDVKTGLWFDITDKASEPRNYPEASGSCMFTYMLAKGVRNGYLAASYLAPAKKAYAGILKTFIETTNGQTDLKGTVSVSGLGGKPYRDGSFAYYMSEPVVVNDPKGMGAFIQCAVEMEMVETQNIGKGKTVLLDRYFNSEKKKDVTGTDIYWHYTWDERANGGFSTLGYVFRKYGASLASLDEAPTTANLGEASVYIIVDPDHVKDNPNPNYVTGKDAKTIAGWVKAGGVLLLMANDSANCDLEHFNKLGAQFGITFTNKSINMVKNDEFETGVVVPQETSIFRQPYKMYLKEVSTLAVKAPAKALTTKAGDIIIATARYGKGTVFAVGDPWLYNEYMDGRKLPLEYPNYKAGTDLVKWLLTQAKNK